MGEDASEFSIFDVFGLIIMVVGTLIYAFCGRKDSEHSGVAYKQLQTE